MAIVNHDGFRVPPHVPPNVDWFRYSSMRWDVLSDLISRQVWRRGVELGAFDGRTMAKLLAQHPDLHMIGVDLWAPQPGNDGPEDYALWPHAEHEAQCRKRMQMFGDRAMLLKMRTADAAAHVGDGTLDFVFIDADHSTEAVIADIAAWLPKLRETGWLIGHDVNWGTVQKALDERAPNYVIGPNVTWMRPKNGIWPAWATGRKPKTAWVLGGGDTLQEDIGKASRFGEPDAVVACNDAGAVWGGDLDAWVSLHPNKFPKWIAEREAKGYPAARRYFGHRSEMKGYPDFVIRAQHKFEGQNGAGGSSGCFAAKVALTDLGFDRVVLCGVPMEPKANHFFDAKPWHSCERYWREWQNIPAAHRARMRSMSGRTKRMLGDEAWG